jgi:hypothetical protein
MAPDAGKAAHQGRAVQRLELVKLRAVDDAGDDLAHVIGRAHIGGDDAVEFLGVEFRRLARFDARSTVGFAGVQVGHDGADDLQGVLVVLGHMVDHAGPAAVGVGAAQLLGADDLAGGGLHQRRAGQEDGALACGTITVSSLMAGT